MDSPAHTRRTSPRLFAALILCLLAGVSLLSLGVYMVPADARVIYGPFQEFGEQASATVVAKQTVQRSYVGGGRRARRQTYEELVMEVNLEGRTITIGDLVLASDYEALSEGDDVEVTYVRGQQARDALPTGPYYLLTASVEASPLAYLGWAFNGRPAHPGAIFSVIPGLLFMLATGVLILVVRTKEPQPEV